MENQPTPAIPKHASSLLSPNVILLRLHTELHHYTRAFLIITRPNTILNQQMLHCIPIFYPGLVAEIFLKF